MLFSTEHYPKQKKTKTNLHTYLRVCLFEEEHLPSGNFWVFCRFLRDYNNGFDTMILTLSWHYFSFKHRHVFLVFFPPGLYPLFICLNDSPYLTVANFDICLGFVLSPLLSPMLSVFMYTLYIEDFQLLNIFILLPEFQIPISNCLLTILLGCLTDILNRTCSALAGMA